MYTYFEIYENKVSFINFIFILNIFIKMIFSIKKIINNFTILLLMNIKNKEKNSLNRGKTFTILIMFNIFPKFIYYSTFTLSYHELASQENLAGKVD